MSVAGTGAATGAATTRRKVTLPRLAGMKRHGEPIAMVTAYDFPGAQLAEEAGADIVLVGDSAAMTVLGYDSTVPVTMEEMLMLTKAVRRGLRAPLLVGDMPFASYQISDAEAVANAARFAKEAGCDAVKMEGAGATLDRVRAVVGAGVAVMGHVGLTPQSATMLGGYRAQARSAAAARRLLDDALALEAAGCFSIVLEAVPAACAAEIAPLLEVPAIGIGAGSKVDGQVLVFHDILTLHAGPAPRFVKRFADARSVMRDGLAAFVDEVRCGDFPGEEHTYGIGEEELAELRRHASEVAARREGTPTGSAAAAPRPGRRPRSPG